MDDQIMSSFEEYGTHVITGMGDTRQDIWVYCWYPLDMDSY